MVTNTVFFCFIFLIWAVFLEPGLLAADDSGVVRREGFEIIIGGGYSPPPEYEEDCPPPPPPPCPPPPPPPPPPDPNVRLKIAVAAIRKFQKKITQDPKKIMETWKGDDPCNWKGFVCGNPPDLGQLRAVAGVDFNGYNLGGCDDFILDGFLNGLPDITIFHANSNNFKGGVPKIDRNKLRYLYELDLSNNKLHGEFPQEVLAATQLTFLDLRFNSFSGYVPQQIFTLDVDVIFINNNEFHQPLPENLGDTPALYLTFANNHFTGQIPRSIGRSKNLLEVLFLNNQLSGCLPFEIGYLKDSTVFDVGKNQLTGPIPHSFGCLDKMELLNLAENKFYGPVPETLCELPNLSNLSLSHNYFTQVGPKCRKLISEKKLDVRKNCILGLRDQKQEHMCSSFFSTVGQCPDPKSLLIVPCGRYPSNRPTSSKPSAMRTYDTLFPHRP